MVTLNQLHLSTQLINKMEVMQVTGNRNLQWLYQSDVQDSDKNVKGVMPTED